jgi:class 3 adenylate cyclase
MAVAAREALRERGLLSAPDPPRGPLLVGFRSPGTSFPRYAVTDVVEGNVPNAWLRRAAVLVGRVDSRSGDRQLVSVPGEPGAGGRGLVEMAGVEVQANCLAALLSRRPPARTSMPADIAIGVLAAAAAAWLVEACGVGLGAVISIVVLLGGGVLASAVAVGSSGYVVSFMPAVLGVLVYAQLYGWMARRRLARSLGQLAGRDLLRQIGQLQAEAGVGEVVPVAVLVFDLRGTTAMAAEAPPEGVGNSISRLLAAVGERVLAHNGIVNKFLGDGLLALFTPSLGCPEAARQAIAAAQSACRLLTGDVANEWERHSGAPLRFVMAVHYGRAWLGFVGLPRRLEMTALGNIVNTTFELERAAKDRGDVFLASAEAMQEAGVSPGDEWERVEVPVRGRAKRELCYSWCERKGLSEHEGDGVGSTDVGGTGSE